ncbi:MAG: 5-dehydro-2-deoxygluconokinase [Pseudomonadota bacterium]
MTLIEGLRRNRFLLVGRAGMDFCPDPPGTATEDGETFIAGLGGSAANIAAGICKLGGEAAILTSVSDDAIGRFCLNQLARYGVDTGYVTAVGGEARNSLAVYESRVEGHQSVIYRNGAADFQMTKAHVEAVDYGRFGALITAGTVFAAEPSRTAAFHAIDLARAAGLPVLFDIDYRPYSWPSPQVAMEVLSRAGAVSDVIVGNDEEFGFMAGGIDAGFAKARDLAGTSAAIVVYKMGPEGAVTFAGGREMRSGVFAVDALKPTGAGDSFMAGLVAGLAEGRPLEEAVRRGSACAAIVVARVGCAAAMPVPGELDDFLATHPGPSAPKEAADAYRTV